MSGDHGTPSISRTAYTQFAARFSLVLCMYLTALDSKYGVQVSHMVASQLDIAAADCTRSACNNYTNATFHITVVIMGYVESEASMPVHRTGGCTLI